MMVDFLGIGVQKGGTTWLYHHLGRHPQVAFPGGKEVHFWDRCDPAVADRWLESLQPPNRLTADGRPIRCGEITPAYSILDPAAIAALRGTCPEIRLFISLRNPLARAWSAAQMALVRAGMLEHEASDQWFIDHFRSQASRQRGAYANTLLRWWDQFPRDQLLVTLLDDIAAKPATVLAALARHLRVDEADFAALSPTDVSTVVVPQLERQHMTKQRIVGAVRPSLIPVLRDIYAAEIGRLERLLDRELGGWLADPGPAAATAAEDSAAPLAIGCGGRGVALTDFLAVSNPRVEKWRESAAADVDQPPPPSTS